MRYFLRLLCVVFFGCSLHAQKPNDRPVVGPPAPATSPSAPSKAEELSQTPPAPPAELPLTPERRAQVRDLQYQYDQLQIQIEQLKQQQIGLNDLISTIATDFAKIEKLNPAEYNLDPKNLKLVRLKTAAPPPAQPGQPAAQPGETFITKPIPKDAPAPAAKK